MADAVPTILAILAVALIATALVAMATGQLLGAGLSFLSASLVIYFRETRLRDAD